MGTSTTAAERLYRLAANARYHGPSNDVEVEMIRTWVLNGESTLDRSEQHSAPATPRGGQPHQPGDTGDTGRATTGEQAGDVPVRSP